MRTRIVAAIVIEVTYAVLTRAWLPQHMHGPELELGISAFRLATAGAYWLLFRDVILSRPSNDKLLRSPLLFAATAVALSIPILFHGGSPGGGVGTALLFAATSIIVGLREELLYRAVLINLLQPRLGILGAIALSTALFLVYHYGALPLAPLPAIEVVCMSLLLGVVYTCSGSLVFVVAVHSLYDAIWALGPHMVVPVPDVWRPLFFVTALTLVVIWSTHLPGNFGARAPLK